GKYDLKQLNGIRLSIMNPLEGLLSARPQSGSSLLGKLSQFLTAIHLPENMGKLASGVNEEEVDQHEQAWTVFSELLVQMVT
ncbi:hypothetical protein ACXWPN_09885, partial [Streptococcus pyogenes]